MVRTAFLVVHDRQQAEDIAQYAFTQLLVHWPKISRYDRPESWVRRVAIRAAVRHVRRERMRETLNGGSCPSNARPPGELLRHALAALDGGHRGGLRTAGYTEEASPGKEWVSTT